MGKKKKIKKGVSLFGGNSPSIPVSAQMHNHTMFLTQTPAKVFYYNAKKFVEDTADVAGYYQMDEMVPIADAYNYEVEVLGGKMIYGENSMPTIDFRDPLVKNPEDLRTLRKKEVDWFNDGRMPFVLDCIKYSLEYGVIQGAFCAPFSLAVGLRSYPGLIRDMRKRPEFVHDLFTFIVEDVLVPFIKAQNQYCDVLVALGADAWACVPNLSVEDMKKWVVPYNKLLMKKAKKIGVITMCVSGDYCEERIEKFDAKVLHGCFDIQIECSLMPMLFMAMGRWQDYPLEPVVDYLNKVRDEQGLNIPIAAGLNARLVRDGPIDKIVDTIKRFIDTFAREHDLTIGPANIPADTPSDHVHAAIAATHTYGLKPIADDLDKIKFKPPKRESFQEWKKNLAKNAK